MIDSPVLTQLKARFTGLDVYDVEPASLPDVMAGRPVVLWGKWRGEPQGAKLVLQGHSASGSQTEVVDAPTPDADAVALKHLWARQRIAQLGDEEALMGGQTQREPITALGLKYGLLTSYTSFIAVDLVVRNPNPALTTTVKHPSPMPAGVSNLAIGAEVPSTPEAEGWLALAITLAILAVAIAAVRRRGC